MQEIATGIKPFKDIIKFLTAAQALIAASHSLLPVTKAAEAAIAPVGEISEESVQGQGFINFREINGGNRLLLRRIRCRSAQGSFSQKLTGMLLSKPAAAIEEQLQKKEIQEL
ncbi:hypothetical protein [Parasitella parasitica]|uniref:Uncharacterized protein n=1 Tax=Parasitella parasitica TaxID=35722 RepID=A0A0B7N5L1_9FUNG|nr:hypothetical protein [Parasitella parasitica]